MRGQLVTHFDGRKVLTVEFTDRDLMTVNLDKFDRAMLAEPSQGIADMLLDAELIARRIEQASTATGPQR